MSALRLLCQPTGGSSSFELSLDSQEWREAETPIWSGLHCVHQALQGRQVAIVETDLPIVQQALLRLYTGQPVPQPLTVRVYVTADPASGALDRQATPAELSAHLLSRQPLWLDHHLTDALDARRQVETAASAAGLTVYYWSPVNGLQPMPNGDGGGDTRELEAALRVVLAARVTQKALFLFDDLPEDDFNLRNTPVGALVIQVCQQVREDSLIYLATLEPHGNVPARWQNLFTVVALTRDQQPTPILDQLGTDLTQQARQGILTALVGRQAEVARLLEILNQARGVPNSVLLVAPPGVGKTALAEGLAVQIAAGRVPPRFRGRRLVQISAAQLLSGTSLRGDLEARLTGLLNEVRANRERLILFLDEVHALFQGQGDGTQLAQHLKQALSRGDLPLIAATTDGEQALVQRDAAFAERFTVVRLDEPSVEEAVPIVQARVADLEATHHVRIEEAVVREVVALADWYLAEHLPRKAINLLNRLASRAELQGMSTVSPQDLRRLLSEEMGVPVHDLQADERAKLGRLRTQLEDRVKFQTGAVQQVVRTLVGRRVQYQKRDPRPVAMLFVGPSGVGKTSLAQAIAECYLGNRKALHRYDMAEYVERFQATKLLGSAPGYVGYDEGSALVNDIRRCPRAVVLFDEVEKAHPDVTKTLMGLLDSGVYIDGRGMRGDFRHAIVVLTSNAIRTPDLEKLSLAELRKIVTEAFGLIGVPTEFLGRTAIVPFHAFSSTELESLTQVALQRMQAELSTHLRVQVEVDQGVPAALCAEAGYVAQGARPVLRRVEELADEAALQLALATRTPSTGLRLAVLPGGKGVAWQAI